MKKVMILRRAIIKDIEKPMSFRLTDELYEHFQDAFDYYGHGLVGMEIKTYQVEGIPLDTKKRRSHTDIIPAESAYSGE